MSQVNYATMSDRELKQYFLNHRQDETAFQAYLEQRRNRAKLIITNGNSLLNV